MQKIMSAVIFLAFFCFNSCEVEKKSAPAISDSGAEFVRGFSQQNVISGENVFPEDVLNEWGYFTTKLSDENHQIRSEKNYGDSSEAFYARFEIVKACFASADEARFEKERIEEVLRTAAGGFKNYTVIVQDKEVLYSINPSGNYVYLEHQPELLRLIVAYLAEASAE